MALRALHTSSVAPAPTHQPFSTLGEKVSRATRSPAAGPAHFRLPETGSQQEGQTDTALGAGGPEQAAAHAPRGHPSEERCLLLSEKLPHINTITPVLGTVGIQGTALQTRSAVCNRQSVMHHHVSHVRVLKFRVPGNKGNYLS